jgi:hypothetical protein
MPPRDIDIQAPLGGLDESAPHQSQPPYTTPDALNVRPFDVIEGRGRIGLRPGLRYARRLKEQETDGEEIGSEIQCISDIDFTAAYGGGGAIINVDSWADDFEGDAIGDAWTQLTNLNSQAYPFPTLFKNGLCYATSSAFVGAATSEPNINAADETHLYRSFTAWIDIVPYRGEFSGTYLLIINADTSAPSLRNCVAVELKLAANGAYSGTIATYENGVVTHGKAFSSSNTDGVFTGRLLLQYSSQIGCYACWNQHDLNSESVIDWIDNPDYLAVGFAMRYDGSEDGGRACISQFGVNFDNATDKRESYKSRLFVANGSAYYEYPLFGPQIYPASEVTLPSTGPLQAVSYNQIAFIASGGEIVGQGSGVVTDNGENALWLAADDTDINFNDEKWGEIPDVGPWASPTYSCELVQADKGVRLGAYRIYSWKNTHDYEINIKGWVPNTPPAGGWAVRWRIVKHHAKFDPKTRHLSVWRATDNANYTNAAPSGCHMITRYYDRIALAGSPQHLIFFGRMGDPYDFFYGDTDVQRAYCTQFSEAGEIGEPVTAMIPFGVDYMVVGCTNSIWKLVGDLPSGGYISNITRATGIATGTSWCRLPDGSLIFVARDGLFVLAAGANSVPVPLSERLPRRLRYCLQNGSRLALAYDHRGEGVWIFHTQDSVTRRTHWWYCLKSKSFWTVSLPDGFEPTAIGYDYDQSVMLGGRDGAIRSVDEMSPTDCGVDIHAYAKIGPFRNGAQRRRIRMGRLRATLSDDSGPASWYIQSGASGELALDAEPSRGGQWTSGTNRTTDPRVGGGAIVLSVANGGDPITDDYDRPLSDDKPEPIVGDSSQSAWAIDGITATLSDGGELRV